VARPKGPPRPAADVVAKQVGDETVLVHLRTNRIYALNRTGAKLWELLEAGHDRSEIQQRMLHEFDVAQEQLTAEIERLLASLAAEQLIMFENPAPCG
jgi:hypothetical protein